MRYLALACDYDGTLAHHGAIDDATLASLNRLRESGRRLLMVTGRELDDLQHVCPHLALFDLIVAENGALLYDPATDVSTPLAEAPPPDFVRELLQRGVSPVSAGRVIVATWEPHDPVVLQVIHDMRLELQVIFNKGAVMVLPTGVNKATGLRRALDRLKLSPHNTIAVGDAENDHAFLAACGLGAAVANALDSLKARADLVTAADHGAGVTELIDRLLANDLAEVAAAVTRHDVVIGRDDGGGAVRLPAQEDIVLLAGPRGRERTGVALALLERLCGAGFQCCVLDSDGSYEVFPDAVALRGGNARALADEALHALDRPSENVVIGLRSLRDPAGFVQMLLPRLQRMRSSMARPHWLLIDEADEALPEGQALERTIVATAHPDRLAPSTLERAATVIAAGGEAQSIVDTLARRRADAGVRLPAPLPGTLPAWLLRLGGPMPGSALSPGGTWTATTAIVPFAPTR